ncbi:hypothetical protein HPB49_021635 [Dermacentor silvarum]|uniref:Uncharacterized protein n=1 Tax=Dermacentor silvarum TaxID=543639 RepID=A0ACB8C5N1_DERSI|nr:hypothetical protein HPB49_021635 [Dermacentor silvarum]
MITFLYDRRDADNLMLKAALASESFAVSAKIGLQPSDGEGSGVIAPDWSIQKECERPLDALFMVSSEASDWSSRADFRNTLLDDRSKKAFRWAGAFVLKETKEPLVGKWIEVEGRVAGDLIVLPSVGNGSTNASDALHMAVQWALDHCAGAHYVIKLVDDTAVHPLRLKEFLSGTSRHVMGDVHCDMRVSSTVHPRNHVVLAAKGEGFEAACRRYCADSVVLASLKLLRALLSEGSEAASAPTLFQHQHRGTSFGIRKVPVVTLRDISLDSNWNYYAFVKLGHVSTRRLDRYALWYFALWKDVVRKNSGFRKLLSGVEQRNSVLEIGLENYSSAIFTAHTRDS